jgi:hypothetical protein
LTVAAVLALAGLELAVISGPTAPKDATAMLEWGHRHVSFSTGRATFTVPTPSTAPSASSTTQTPHGGATNVPRPAVTTAPARTTTTAPGVATTSPSPSPCNSSMAPPAGWSSAQLTNDDHFSSLKNWNYGVTDDLTSGTSGLYATWGQTGTAPYLGSTLAAGGLTQDYALPGNVFQTSTGANSALLSTYSPQAFNLTGCGVSFTATYTGDRTYDTTNEGSFTLPWTSGFINSYNKISFPTAGHTAFYVQFMAEMGCAGPNDNNGSWSSMWFLGQGNEQREIDLQESGVDGGESTQLENSHLQSPVVSIDSYNSGINLCDSYNTYGVSLVGGVVTTYINGVQTGQATSGTTGPYFAILGQDIYSPHDAFASAPTSNVNMTESIAEMQVYQR